MSRASSSTTSAHRSQRMLTLTVVQQSAYAAFITRMCVSEHEYAVTALRVTRSQCDSHSMYLKAREGQSIERSSFVLQLVCIEINADML